MEIEKSIELIALYIGFLYGFWWCIFSNDFWNEPLCTIIGATIYGFIYAGCTIFVTNFVPLHFRCFVPILLILVIVYKCHRRFG